MSNVDAIDLKVTELSNQVNTLKKELEIEKEIRGELINILKLVVYSSNNREVGVNLSVFTKEGEVFMPMFEVFTRFEKQIAEKS